MSHLACADHPDDPMNERQRDALQGLARQAAAGAGEPGQLRRHVPRRGIPFRSGAAGYRAVWRACARGQAQPDAHRWCGSPPRSCRCARWHRAPRVGYGATYKVQKPSRIATIAVGYADGFLRALSVATGEAGPVGYIGDYPVPIVGRVSMDFITADVTERAAGAGAARRLGGGDGPPRHRRRPHRPRRHHRLRAAVPPRPARLSRLRGRGPEPHGQGRQEPVRLPELRCGGLALGRQVRRLRRVEHHDRGGRRARGAGLRPGAQLARGGSSSWRR